jgi:hypothetical protein
MRGGPSQVTRFKQLLDSRLEKKSINIGSSSATSATGTVLYLTPIPQDDTVNGRSGDVIRPTLLELRYSFQDTTNINYYRIIVFKDNMNQGAAPAVTDVLNSADYSSAYAYINVEQMRRFTIVFDEVYGMTPSGFNAQVHTRKLRLKGTTHFIGTGNTTASAGKDTYWAIVISGVAGAGQNFNCRLNFTDA